MRRTARTDRAAWRVPGADRSMRVVQVQTERASPFATALLFGYIGAFIYDGDAPLAERRAQALTLDTALLSELLGQAELREIIDAEALANPEESLQRLSAERRLRSVDDLHDALLSLGDLSGPEIAARGGRAEWASDLDTDFAPGSLRGQETDTRPR